MSIKTITEKPIFLSAIQIFLGLALISLSTYLALDSDRYLEVLNLHGLNQYHAFVLLVFIGFPLAFQSFNGFRVVSLKFVLLFRVTLLVFYHCTGPAGSRHKSKKLWFFCFAKSFLLCFFCFFLCCSAFFCFFGFPYFGSWCLDLGRHVEKLWFFCFA
jgi:hypothetical protein